MAGYQLERDMAGAAERWLRAQGLIVKREYATPWGVCDFIAVQLDDERVQQRISLGQRKSVGPLLRIDMLMHIPEVETGRSTSVSRLCRRYSWLSIERVVRELDALRSGNFITADRGFGKVQKVNGWAPLHRRVVAVELKLARVDDVLNQIANHRRLATECYIGMPAAVVDRLMTSARARAIRSGAIGVLAFDGRNCDIVLHARPHLSTKPSVVQLHCVERFWRSATQHLIRDSST